MDTAVGRDESCVCLRGALRFPDRPCLSAEIGKITGDHCRRRIRQVSATLLARRPRLIRPEDFQPRLDPSRTSELIRLLGRIDEFKGHWRKLRTDAVPLQPCGPIGALVIFYQMVKIYQEAREWRIPESD